MNNRIERFHTASVCTEQAFIKISIDEISDALNRHFSGDFGTAANDSIELNEESIKNGYGDVLSEYQSSRGITFWVVTNDDWKITTVLLPEEY